MHSVNIIVNGEPRDLSTGSTIASLIHDLELSERRVAVEVNKAIVRRAEHAEHHLRDGDIIEIVTLVGGG